MTPERFDDLCSMADRGDLGCGPKTEQLVRELVAEHRRVLALIHNPHTDEFLEAVRAEAAHQRERWGTTHDAGKTAPDWFWLLGYLGGKAMQAWKADDVFKLKHHIITTAAACLNWHAAVSGADNSMMPGIAPPDGEMPT